METKREQLIDRETQARTILDMTREAIESGDQKKYWKVLGYVEGLERSGEIQPRFMEMLQNDIKDQWDRRQSKKRERFRFIWRMTE